MPPRLTIALMLALAVTCARGMGTLAATADPEQARQSASSALLRFTATDLDSQRWTAASLRGRVVLIDFWATWCAPCLAELPRLKALHARHPRKDFEILGISLDATSRQSLISWLNRNRIDWPQVHERSGYSGDVPRLFGIDRLPKTLLLDRDGAVAAVDLRGERLVAQVDDLVAAAVPPASPARMP
jgi:thiol-disulfide isomerase/thioredoxin